MEKILITGAGGQLGSELYIALIKNHGEDNVIATDLKISPSGNSNIVEQFDVTDKDRLLFLVKKYQITQIYNLAAILSAVGEKQPQLAWKVNIEGHLNVLEIASQMKLKIFWPSSIAVFGPGTPSDLAPQDTVMNPQTVYGISKLAGEKWCEYYCSKYGVDVRSLRYPGLIGYKSLPGGGTTDYAVDIYHKAVSGETFNCFLQKDTYLPLMYMPDAVKATLQLMEAPSSNIKIRTSYNVSAISVSPEDISNSIKKQVAHFKINYIPDFRQEIADSWPKSIDDCKARKDWGWQPSYSLDAMTEDMLLNILQAVKS